MRKQVTEHISASETASAATDSLTLPFELRQRSRLLTRLDSGAELALVLPRGRVLRGGDTLKGPGGIVVEVRAASEPCSTVRATESAALARVAYHLGNRHVPLQVGDGFVRYLADHVLDDMVHALGLHVTHESAAFEPEAGAYGGHSHAHEHEHQHEHAHPHNR